MIDEKEIYSAAFNYQAEENGAPKSEEAFMNGAKWMLREFVKSLWHSAEEEPQRYDDYLVKTIQGCIDSCFFDMNGWHEPKIGGGQVCQWLDLSDILPKVEGE